MIDPSAPAGYQPPQPPAPPPSGSGQPPAGAGAPPRGPVQPPADGGQPRSGSRPTAGGYPHAGASPTAGTYPTAGGYQGQAPGQPPFAGYPAYGSGQPPPPYETPRRRVPRRDPGGLVAGLVIAGIGLFFLAGQLEPDIGEYITLFIGLALLAVFVIRREYGFLVPGSILTGVGIGIALVPHVSRDAESGVMMLALAGGFLGIWVLGSIYRLPQNHWWPLIPGGILTLIGLVQLSRADLGGALSLWPIILIIAGALLLGRWITRRDD